MPGIHRIRAGRFASIALSTHRAVSFVAGALLLIGCGGLDRALSPGRRAGASAPAQVALTARLPAFAKLSAAAARLRVTAAYERVTGARVPLAALDPITLIDAPTQQVSVPIELEPCLADSQRRSTETGAVPGAACVVWLELTLLDGERVVDQVTLGPVTMTPGGPQVYQSPVVLVDVADVRVAPAAGARMVGTSVRLELDNPMTFTAAVISTSGQTVTGRAVRWASDAPNVARVDTTTGAVTPIGVGRARITATLGTHSGVADVVVVPRPSRIAVTAATSGPGAGSGRVRSTPAGIDCHLVAGREEPGTTCAFTFPGDAQVVLTASPDAGSLHASWGGACAAATGGTCQLGADQARTATVVFTALQAVTVSLAGTGSGSVSSNPSGVTCPSTCTASFPVGAAVTLTAAPNARSTFAGWSGACAGTQPSCVVVAAAGLPNVTATFTERRYALTVGTSGTGVGRVTSSAGGIDCPGTCAASYTAGDVVTLTATPANGSTFGGWSGACSGTGITCTVTMGAAQTVTATFSRVVPSYPLTVSTGGTGRGTVTSSGGINCPGACSGSYTEGTVVTLSAAPTGLSVFGGWSGGCTGTSTACTVTINAPQSVTATFTLPTYQLSVSITGGGAGTVSSPVGINCPGTCTASVDAGTQVTLTAVPASGSTFAGWSGACGSAGTSPTCTVAVTATSNVTAVFIRTTYPLTVTVGGSGTGTVTSAPAGISCPGTCVANFPAGTSVSLTATPTNGSTIGGWSAACAGSTNPCQVSVNSATSVGVTFNAPPPTVYPLTATLGGTGTGRVSSSPAGIDCPSTCTASFPAGMTVVLSATPATGSVFSGWSPSCGSTNPCTVILLAATTVGANFTVGPVLIGRFNLSYRNNAAGCGPTDANPYACGTSPGPIHVAAPPGTYRAVIVSSGTGEGNPAIWDGTASAGIRRGFGVDFVHTSGEITLYHFDWFTADNPPTIWVVELYRVN